MSASVSPNTKSLSNDDDLSRQIEALRADLARLATTAGDNLADGISDAGRRIGQGGRDARAAATGAVLEHPLAAVAMAAGFGFLLGMITRRG